MRYGLLAAAAVVLAACATVAEPERWPARDARAPEPAGNPSTPEKIELGRRLFYDADLSLDGTIACSSCHVQRRGFTETNPTRAGVNGALGRRNPLTLANVGFYASLTWHDHSQTSLETQAKTPIIGEHPIEMGMAGQEAELARRLSADACYVSMFAAAFPGERVSMETVGKALGAFQRSMVSLDAPYDRAKRGGGVLPEAAVRGEKAFGAFGCASCHAGPMFTDAAGADARAAFHNIGDGDGRDLGLMEITGAAGDREKFRTPSLRNVLLSAPYLHDGSAATLAQAIRAHERPGAARDAKLGSRAMGEAELNDVIAFLATLTDVAFVSDPRFALPKEACGRPL